MLSHKAIDMTLDALLGDMQTYERRLGEAEQAIGQLLGILVKAGVVQVVETIGAPKGCADAACQLCHPDA